MAQGGSPDRPIRARKSVRTYNLKILSGITRRSRQPSRNVDPQSARRPESRRASSGGEDSLKATENPGDHRQQYHDDNSSELTSPMLSPNLLALETSLSEEGMTVASTRSSGSGKSTGRYDCFNAMLHPKGHYYSAKELFARGVWIGYLSPDRHNESFRGLPSFGTLKSNFNKFSQPYPTSMHGSVRENRNAVCRGCAKSNSALIALSEIQFVRTSKLVIMPLDGDDNAGVFAIMLPQKVDRSLRGLQIYRPYELTNDGKGDTFVNNYMLLTLRNPISEAGTLETVLEVLSTQEHAATIQKDVSLPNYVLDDLPTSSYSSTIPEINSGLRLPIARVAETIVDDETSVASKRRKTGSTPGESYNTTGYNRLDGTGMDTPAEVALTPESSEPEREVAKSPCLDESVTKGNSPAQQQSMMTPEPSILEAPADKAPNSVQSIPRDDSPVQRLSTMMPELPQPALHATNAPISVQSIPRDEIPVQQPKTMKPEAPKRTIQTTEASIPVQSKPLGITDEQAECVHLVWTVNDSEIEYDFVHTLGECKTFAGLLSLLEEDAEAIPAIAGILARTKTWRMTFRLSDGTKKAIVARKGAEAAFNRLKLTLAQAPIWSSNPNSTVDVELKLLS
ncbi:hypothetical protein PtrSN002B_003240 [Pyrenophora tritici-repentis]|uniref:Uncharacterized protein n=1 Tax=Pyrenophora tritici-repentis TaxID=45151 RepID=A0A2W1DCQ1_9PLEO|nr:hypothetical protein Ptr86124_002626 [Pyrenophora tritici-repentis]KAI1542757.1 hypothetical protein PtrSN001A_003308 [Pyrenophora tritici-repentis]KAI1545856.1 hypothetical protein PtrSN001C_003031 [Pyrenophora tritici-repentis]KAI1555194.1 hypothetical protein PtrSN002B_003240 [Pyrenophora tritici-repentis]KAI1574048.1 hypothetical protein PtrEW4_003369 [Pyrenophora tritici-repentis]